MKINPFFLWENLSDSVPDKYWKKLLSNVKLSAHSGRAGFGLKPKTSNGVMALKNHDVLIGIDDLKLAWDLQKGRCYWLGGLLDMDELYRSHSPFAPSVDRLNNSMGYVPGNIVIASRFANKGRGAYDGDDLLQKLTNLIELKR